MKKLPLLALVVVSRAALADEPKDLLATVTTAHVLPSVRTAEALVRKLSPTTAAIKLEAMASVVFGLDRAMAEAFEGPVDLAVLKDAAGSMGGGALSMPWKDPTKLRGIGMADPLGVRRVPVDATPVLPQIASAASAPQAACALYPSPVAPGHRLVCGTTPQALATLGPYLANDVAREARPSDVALRFPVSNLVDAAERELSTGKLGDADVTRAAAQEAFALGRDVASGAITLGWDADALTLALDFRFSGSGATTSRLLMSASEHGRAMPDFFDRLPTDTYAFGTLGGFDPSVALEAAHALVDLGARAAGQDAQAGVALIRPIVVAIASKGFACSFAAGFDAKRALKAVESLQKKRTDAAVAKASSATNPWFAFEFDALVERAPLVESALSLAATDSTREFVKGSRWPVGTKAWTFEDGTVVALLPRAESFVLAYGADASLVSEKLKSFAGLPAPRLKVADSSRDAFRERPAAVLVVTDRVADVLEFATDEHSVDASLASLRFANSRTDEPAQFVTVMAVTSATESTGWNGSVRIGTRAPVTKLLNAKKAWDAKSLAVARAEEARRRREEAAEEARRRREEAAEAARPRASSGGASGSGRNACVRECIDQGIACLNECPNPHALDSCTAPCFSIRRACQVRNGCP
jgi:hypothetical protein